MNYDTSSACSVHPKVAVIGVCHLCLHEQLLILAVDRSQSNAHKHYYNYNNNNNTSHSLKQQQYNNKKTQIKITNKIFALRNSILTRFDSLRRTSHSFSDNNDTSATSTPDHDSFISIKFEDNGVASWDKGISVSKVSLDHCNISWNNHKTTKSETKTDNIRDGRTVIKHPEMPRGGSMRWRKRIGHMFQLIRWKRSSSKGSGGCHSNVRTNSNIANGWIRTLTKRRTKE